MSRRAIKILISSILILVLMGAAIGIYIHNNSGPIVGRVQNGAYYHLTSFVQSERFPGMTTITPDSYFRIDSDGKTGKMYLNGLSTTDAPIPFIITSYNESNKETTFQIEYIIPDGEATKIQSLTAVSQNNTITLRGVQSYDVRVIQQQHNDISSLKYEIDLLTFTLDNEEAQAWSAV